MKSKCWMLIVGLGVCLAAAHVAEAVTVVYTDRALWENAVGGAYDEEFFQDATLNPGVSVVSSVGHVDTGLGVWWDRVDGNDVTTFTFASPITAYGGNWDLAGPGGPGSGAYLFLDGVRVDPQISPNSAGGFFGVVSGTPFTSVLLTEGAEPQYVETLHLDNMVYSPSPAVVPEPITLLGLLSGGAALTGYLRKRK